jgi:hypothetical protein
MKVLTLRMLKLTVSVNSQDLKNWQIFVSVLAVSKKTYRNNL